VARAMRAAAADEPLVRIDYAVAVDAASLEEPGDLDDVSSLRLLIAARVGPVRLIDNCAAVLEADAAGATATEEVRQLERIG